MGACIRTSTSTSTRTKHKARTRIWVKTHQAARALAVRTVSGWAVRDNTAGTNKHERASTQRHKSGRPTRASKRACAEHQHEVRHELRGSFRVPGYCLLWMVAALPLILLNFYWPDFLRPGTVPTGGPGAAIVVDAAQIESRPAHSINEVGLR